MAANREASTNGDEPWGEELYDFADECCRAEFTASSGSGDSCPRINTCFDTDEPTASPKPAPTSCGHEPKWYLSFNPYVCTNWDDLRRPVRIGQGLLRGYV